MADPEMVAILKRGSSVWNHWRKQQPDDEEGIIRFCADLSDSDLQDVNLSNLDLSGDYLSGANLSNANLRGADLSSADLSNANLQGADLSDADLSNTNLSAANLNRSRLKDTNLCGANLSDANLSNATLIGADLSEIYLNDDDPSYTRLINTNLSGSWLRYVNLSNAILNNANLRESSLYKIDLSNANLHGSDLSNTTIAGVVFDGVDLRMTKGLAEIKHQGPSHIALHSVRLPQDGSALHFLRGCGVPDEWIDFYRAQMMFPIQYHSCFISYSSKDDLFARHLHAYLQDRGVRCWFAPHSMRIGDKIRPSIDKAIHQQDKLLLILSEDSVASDWVEHEVEIALAREHKEKRTILFPIRSDNAILEREYTGWAALVQNERHIGDFTNWTDPQAYQQSFERLLLDLKTQE